MFAEATVQSNILGGQLVQYGPAPIRGRFGIQPSRGRPCSEPIRVRSAPWRKNNTEELAGLAQTR